MATMIFRLEVDVPDEWLDEDDATVELRIEKLIDGPELTAWAEVEERSA